MFDSHVSLLNGVHRQGTKFSSSSRTSSRTSSSNAATSRKAVVGKPRGEDGLIQLQRQYQDPPSAYYTARQQLVHDHPELPAAEDEQQGRQRRPQQWPRPLDEVCKAVSKRLKQAGSCAEVLQVVQQHVEQFNQINTALAYAQLARHLRFETSSNTRAALQHASYAALQATAVQQAAQFNPRQLGMILTSMAWMLCCDSAPADETALTHLEQQHPTVATAAAQSHGAERFSSQEPYPGVQNGDDCNQQQQQQRQQQRLLLSLLACRLQALLDAFEPEDTCHCLWALEKLGALQQDLLTAATAHSLSAGWLHRLTAKPLTSVLWVHAHAHLTHPQQPQVLQSQVPVDDASLDVEPHDDARAPVSKNLLRERFVHSVMCEVAQPGFLATWTPQELSMLMWSCAVLGVPLEQQQQQQHQQAPTLGAQDAGDLAWHHPGSQHGQAAVPLNALQQVCQLAKQHVVQFTPQGVTMMVWSMAALLEAASRHAAPSVLSAATAVTATSSAPGARDAVGALEQQRQQYQFTHKQTKQLSALPPQLQEAVHGMLRTFAGAAAARMQYYKPQEVSNIFAAYTRLKMLPAGLQQAVEAYVPSHAHRLNGKDVTDLLLGAAQLSQGRPLQGPRSQQHLAAAAVRAVLHRTVALLPALNPFQLSGGAWACSKLAQQYSTHTARASPGPPKAGVASSSSSSSSPLVEECLAAASELLGELDSRLAQQRASTSSTTAAAAGAESSVDSWASSGFYADKILDDLQGVAIAQGGLPDMKQAVALAWALTASAGVQHITAQSAAWTTSGLDRNHHSQKQQQQLQELPAAVLRWLHHHVQHCSDATSLAHVYAVLVPLLHVFVRDSPDKVQLGEPHALVSSLQTLREATRHRLMDLLPQLPAAAAVITAWADAKWQVQMRLAIHDAPRLLQSGPAASDLSVLTAVVQHLHDLGQLSKLPAQSVAMLLWSCQVFSWEPKAAAYTQLLAAAHNQLLHIPAHHQVVLLQALTRAASPTAGQEPALMQQGMAEAQQQQAQAQRAQVIQQLVEQLQLQLNKQAVDVSWQLRHAAKRSAHVSRELPLQVTSLVKLAAVCGDLQQQQQQQQQQLPRQDQQLLLQQLVDVWQLMLQLGVVSSRDALLMIWHLADVLPGSPAETWHKAVLHQLKQQQQHVPAGLSHMLPQLMRHAIGQLYKQLSVLVEYQGRSELHQDYHLQQQENMPLAPSTLVVALKVFAKLHFQPPVQILSPMLQQLQTFLPLLQDEDVSAAVLAISQLGLPAHGFTEAATAMLARRQQEQQHQALAAEGSVPAEGQQQQQQGLCRKPSQPRMSRPCSLSLLWAVLSSRAALEANSLSLSGSITGNTAAPSSRWLVKLAHHAAGIDTMQLLQQPHLLLLSQQVWQMMSTLPQYRALQRTMQLSRPGVHLPHALLLSQLRAMTWVLLAKTVTGSDRQQALLHMLHASPGQLANLFHQRLCLGQQMQQAASQKEERQLQLLQHCTALLPWWLQYQLQKQCQQQLAVEVVKAQVAAKGAAAKVVLRLTPSGEAVLLLRPQQSAQDCGTGHLSQQLASPLPQPGDEATAAAKVTTSACSSSSSSSGVCTNSSSSSSRSSSSSSSCAAGSSRGVAVVFQSPHITLNSTGEALGHASTRDVLLRAEGFTVLSVPLQPWLPTYLLRHQHELQMQQFEHRPAKQQHLKHLLSQNMRKLTKQRTRLVQHVVQLLQQVPDTP